MTTKVNPKTGEVTVLECAACGCEAEGNYSVHRDGFCVGPEVPLCDACGDSERPTLTEIWDAIARRRGTVRR